MSDKEAYELLFKYGGGEKGIAKVREMIHIAGIDTAVKNTMIAYEKNAGKGMPSDVKEWIYQSYRYVAAQIVQSN